MDYPQPTRLFTHGVTAMTIMLWLLATALVFTRLWLPATPLWPVAHTAALQGGVMAIALVWMICISPTVRLNRLLSLFCIAAAASIVLNGGQSVSAARLALFILVMLLISPLAVSDELNRFRLILWRLTWWTLRLIIIFSFVYFIIDTINDRIPGSGFGGLPVSAIWLGILSTLVLLNSFWHLTNNRQLSTLAAFYHGLLLAFSVMLIIATGSRSALLASAVGLCPLLWAIRRNRFKLLLFFISLIGIVTSYAVCNHVNRLYVVHKTEYTMNFDGIAGIKKPIWNARLQEFGSSPLYGIGFGTSPAVKIVIKADDKEDDNWYYRNYTTEPGSSWLNLLSTTGIVGFLLISLFNLRLLRHLWRNRFADIHVFYFLIGLLTAMWLHGCFEGGLLYAGNPKFFFYWLLTAIIYQFKVVPYESIKPYAYESNPYSRGI